MLARAWGASAALWTSHGPFGGGIKSLAIDPISPSTLYAGAYGGGLMYRSTDGAVGWTQLGTGFGGGAAAIVVDPTHPMTIFAATTSINQEGIFKSTDGGASWALVLDSFDACRALVMDPS